MNEPPYMSSEWVRTRTDDELRAVLPPLGHPAYADLCAELDRRESARGEKRQLFWIKLTFWTALALGIAGLVTTLLHD